MNCMKCGRETQGEQVFCEDCRLEMEKYPVRPGTVVQLPKRRETSAPRKTPKRRVLPLEEQVKVLKKRVWILLVALVAAIALAAALVYPAALYLMDDHFKLGQNYNSVTTTTTPPTTETQSAN